MQNRNSKVGTIGDADTQPFLLPSSQTIAKPIVSGLLQSLYTDLKGFQENRFLTPDVKIGLGIAIEQLERYMRGDLEARQQ